MTVLDMAIESFEDSLDNYEDHYGEDAFTQYAIEAFDDIMYALEEMDAEKLDNSNEKIEDLLDDANAETDENAKKKKIGIAKRIALGAIAGLLTYGALTAAEVKRLEGNLKLGSFKEYFNTSKAVKKAMKDNNSKGMSSRELGGKAFKDVGKSSLLDNQMHALGTGLSSVNNFSGVRGKRNASATDVTNARDAVQALRIAQSKRNHANTGRTIITKTYT